jgi:two-component system NarL family sensor kinase
MSHEKKENRQANVHVLKEIAELLNEETELAPMLSGVLKRLLEVTGFKTAWIFLIDKQGKHKLTSFENLPSALSANGCQLMNEGGCWCVNRYTHNELTKATNIIECKRIENAHHLHLSGTDGIVYHATVPLHSGNESFGLLNVATPGKERFFDEELALLESIALQIGSAIKRIKLTKKEQDIRVVEERNRLARDLHDSVNQLLFSLTLTARGGIEMTEDKEVQETFQHIQGMAQEALNEMRALIWQLRPQGLENGLVEAVRGYGQMLGLIIHTKVQGVIALPSVVEEALWRVSQEALNNGKKHSGKSEMFFSIEVDNRIVKLTVEDKGKGFEYKSHQNLPTLGLLGMKERVTALGGSFEISSTLGKGTALYVKMPY